MDSLQICEIRSVFPVWIGQINNLKDRSDQGDYRARYVCSFTNNDLEFVRLIISFTWHKRQMLLLILSTALTRLDYLFCQDTCRRQCAVMNWGTLVFIYLWLGQNVSEINVYILDTKKRVSIFGHWTENRERWSEKLSMPLI